MAKQIKYLEVTQKKGGPLDKHYLSTTSTWLTNTPNSSLPKFPNFSQKLVRIRRKRITKEEDSIYRWIFHFRCRWEQTQGQGHIHHSQPEVDLFEASPPWYLFSKKKIRNNIGSIGCDYLSQADMNGIQLINLGNIFTMQATTRWMVQPASSLAELTGGISKQSRLVFLDLNSWKSNI